MFTARAILAFAIALSVQSTTLAEKDAREAYHLPPKKEQKVERRSVSASVTSAVDKGVGIRADKVPGEFTIPEGMTARNFKYRFHDPKGKIKLDKLTGSSIYSITEKRYISEATSGPSFELPPGKYKFVVGGRPGAYGSLSFDMAPGKVTPEAVDHELPKKFDVSTDEVYYIVDDGNHVSINEINQDNPLKLSYKNGQFSGKHTATAWETPDPKSKYQRNWKTTVEASLDQGVLTGKYAEYHTMANHSDATYAGGLLCFKRTMTGQLSGTVDASGRLAITVSGWTMTIADREYTITDGHNIPKKFGNIKGWKERTNDQPLNYKLGFELQLPVQGKKK